MTALRPTTLDAVILDSVEPSASRSFYAAAFGWTVTGPWMATSTADVALIDNAGWRTGSHPAWVPSFQVPDVGSAARQAVQAGAADEGSRTLGGRSWRCLQDQEGVPFALTDRRTSRFSARPGGDRALGGLALVELYSSDVPDALEVYGDALGVDVLLEEVDLDLPYHLLVGGGQPIAGVVDSELLSPQPLAPHWLPYFRVVDVRDEVARIVELGARVRIPFTETTLGDFAVLVGPHGEAFGLQSPLADELLRETARDDLSPH